MTVSWLNWVAAGYRRARNQDLVVLLSLLAVVAGLWLFAELADEVMEGDTRTFDERVVQAMRQADDPAMPLGPPWLHSAARDITALGSIAVLSIVAATVVGFLVLQKRFAACLLLLAALAGGLGLNVLLKSLFERPRPDLVPRLVDVYTASFPSGHSLLSAVVYITLAALLCRLLAQARIRVYLLATALLLSGLVGVSRIYLGVHYPTDVLAGWAVGLIWAILCWLVARTLQRRGLVRPPSDSPTEPPAG